MSAILVRKYFLALLKTILGLSLCFFLLKTTQSSAQSSNAPFSYWYYHLLDRHEIKAGDNLLSSYKPNSRKDITCFLDSIHSEIDQDKVTKYNLSYLQNDNWMWVSDSTEKSLRPFLKKLYERPADFFHVQEKDFQLHINPTLYLSAGRDNNLDDFTYVMSRGVQIHGNIDDKVGFYSFLAENLVRFPSYINSYIQENNVVPGDGFWKRTEDGGVDYFSARAAFFFNFSKHISAQIGHDKHFIGNGYRSLVLSDFANEYFFAKVNTKVWKIEYTNLFAQLIAQNRKVNHYYPKKYLAFHRLGINITSNFNLGLFESTVFSRQDSSSRNYFDLDYINPLIFYRAVEQDIGDPDNVIIGLDFKWNLWKRLQLYGQLVIDELKVKEAFSGDGWWANKHAFQIGSKYIDAFGVKHLDLQAEFNWARPYTYTHYENPEYSNYQHYNQPLAHPLGANFREFVGILRYQPLPKLFILSKLILAKKGLDDTENNFGGDIFKDYRTRNNDYGNTVAQGFASDLTIWDITFTYHLKHNLFIDLKQTYRKNRAAELNVDEEMWYTNISIRLNMPERLFDF